MTIAQDKIRTSLKRLIKENGVDMATVSKAIGKNHAYIQQYLTRGIPAELGYKTAMALADYFSCGVEIFGIKTTLHGASNDAALFGVHALTSIRKLLGLSAEQFASALQEDVADILAIEKGKSPLNEKIVFKICDVFQLSADNFGQYAAAMTEPERAMLKRFRTLTPEAKRKLEVLYNRLEKERA